MNAITQTPQQQQLRLDEEAARLGRLRLALRRLDVEPVSTDPGDEIGEDEK